MRFHLTSTSIDDELKSDFSDDISKIVADYVDIATMCSANEENYIEGHTSFEKFKDMVKALQDVGYGSYPMGGEQYPILVNVNEDGILCLTVYNSYIE
jgi:hypothetical protein